LKLLAFDRKELQMAEPLIEHNDALIVRAAEIVREHRPGFSRNADEPPPIMLQVMAYLVALSVLYEETPEQMMGSLTNFFGGQSRNNEWQVIRDEILRLSE
jgi:hypothetical protein